MGEGTTAELWLLRAKAEAETTPPEIPGNDAAGVRLRPLSWHTVLVVNDDLLVLASASSVLEDLGYAALEAASGRQALEILRAGAKVDLVLTDHAMPGMTGLQLAAELRQLRPNLPVLLTNSHAEIAELARSGLSFRPKPFGQAAMAVAVEKCVENSSFTGGQVVPFRAR